MSISEIVFPRSARALNDVRFPTCDPASFFCLPEWFHLVAECGADASSRFAVIGAGSGEVALPVLQMESKGALRSCTNVYTCEFDVVGNPDVTGVRALAGEILSSFRPSYIRLEGLDPAAGSFSALCDGFGDGGYFVKPYIAWANWYEEVHSDSFETYMARRPSALKNTLHRKQSLLGKTGRFAIQQFVSEEDVEPYIALYQDVERQSWKSAEPYPHFVPNLIRLAAQKRALRMGVLTIGEASVAAQFWIVWNRKALIFKLVHASSFDKFSPGTLLTMHMLRSVLERDKPDEIDFGRGDDSYKRMWVSSRRERWGIEAANLGTLRGIAHAARLSAQITRSFVGRAVSRLDARWHFIVREAG